MNRVVFFSLSLFLYGIITIGLAQYDEKGYFLNGKEDFYAQKYRSALFYFSEINLRNTQHQDAKYYAAICKLFLHVQDEALKDLKSIDIAHLKDAKHYYYWLAEAYFLNENFGKAIDMLKIYNEQNPRNKLTSYTTLLSHLKTSIEKTYRFPHSYTIRNMGKHINSPFQDFGLIPNFELNQLLYSSNRHTFKDKLTEQLETQVLTLYNAELDESGAVVSIEELMSSSSIDSQFTVLQVLDYNLASSDKTFLISQNGTLKILEQKAGKWQITGIFSESLSQQKGIKEYACLSKDKKILVFSSDYKSKGNYELFVARRDDTNHDFGEPQLIEQLNTEAHEITPFLAADNTLYFSSNRPTTSGGFDVFKTTYNNEKQTWNEPTLFHYPINSVADDLYFSCDEYKGYLVSNRKNGEGGEDIYQVFFFDSVQVEGQCKERNLTQKPIANALVRFKKENDTSTYQTLTTEDGRYRITLPIDAAYEMEVTYANKIAYQDFLPLNPYQLASKPQKKYVRNVYLYVEEQNAKTFQKLLKNEKITLQNVYFEQGSTSLKPSSLSVLDDFADWLRTTDVQIEVGVHTNSKENSEVNLQLSLARAECVKNYLIEKGVAAKRLTTVGLGDTKPIFSAEDEKEEQEPKQCIEIRIKK